MQPISDLDILLRSLEPVLDTEIYVFCIVPHDYPLDLVLLQPFALAWENEGVTLIVRKQVAQEAGFQFSSEFNKITLSVNSSLDAVGLTAAISTALAQQGISANIVAAYCHDHVFVPTTKSFQAIEILRGMQNNESKTLYEKI